MRPARPRPPHVQKHVIACSSTIPSLPLAKTRTMLPLGWNPSDYAQDPSQVGSSHEVNRELSWMLPRCGRFRVKWDTCVTYGHPSSNLGRSLFPRGVFLPHPIQQVERTSVAELPATSQGVADCTSRASGLRAVVR
jgi:hypothetical protein